MKRIMLLIICFLVMGCATTSKFNETMDSWLSVNVQDFIRTNGKPDETFESRNGNTVYVYDDSSRFYVPYSGLIENWCYVYVEADQSGTIVNWRTLGDYSCPKKDEELKTGYTKEELEEFDNQLNKRP